METTIAELDYQINQLKQSQNFNECLSLIEKTIGIKSETYGKKSKEFFKTAKDLCDVCNLIALSFLETNSKEEGLVYLMKAEKLFRNHKELLNIIYNNIGCYYRFLGKSSYSMQYLEKALKIAYDLSDKRKAAETHLNISTVLTNLSKFKLAIEQCLACIILIQEDINDNIDKVTDDELNESLVILVLSYQSLAIQHENMNNTTQALLYYQIAENMFRKLRSSGDKDKLDSINKMIDDYYKLKLINKITSEKQDYIDALGEYFNKKFTKSIRRILEENISNIDNSQEDIENDEFEQMPSIIDSEPEPLEDEQNQTAQENCNTNDNNYNNQISNKSQLENEEMIGALKEIEAKITDVDNLNNNNHEGEGEDMDNPNNYSNIIEQKDDQGNLRKTKSNEAEDDNAEDQNNLENNENHKNEANENLLEKSGMDKSKKSSGSQINKNILTQENHKDLENKSHISDNKVDGNDAGVLNKSKLSAKSNNNEENTNLDNSQLNKSNVNKD